MIIYRAGIKDRTAGTWSSLSGAMAETGTVLTPIESPMALKISNCWHQAVPYPTVVCEVGGRVWLVMFSFQGIMESAFVVYDPADYLNPAMFEPIGTLLLCRQKTCPPTTTITVSAEASFNQYYFADVFRIGLRLFRYGIGSFNFRKSLNWKKEGKGVR